MHIGRHVHIVVGVMNIENIAHRAGIEPTSLAFRASVVTISPPSLPLYPRLLVYAAHCVKGVCKTTAICMCIHMNMKSSFPKRFKHITKNGLTMPTPSLIIMF